MTTSIFSKIYTYFFPNCNMIIPRIWLGDVDAAHNVSFLTKESIDIVVNCTPNHPFISDSIVIASDITFLRIPVYDSLLERDFILMEQYMEIFLPYLLQQYTNNKNLLIHCYAGKQRSGILVASLLYILLSGHHIPPQVIGLEKLPSSRQALADTIFVFLLSRRPQVFTFGFRINFIKSFQRYFNLT